MDNQAVIYISPEHNLSEICEHLERVTNRDILFLFSKLAL